MQSTMSDDSEIIQKNLSPSLWVKRTSPNTVVNEHIKFVENVSQKVKATQPCSLGISYGDTQGQKIDLYGFSKVDNDAKILIYVHGGFWQELSREISAYCVEPLISSGVAVAIMGYDLAPIASLDEIVKQIEKGVKFISELAEQRNSKGIYLCGHSAGAHLISMLLNSRLIADKIDLFKGLFMISGIYDLQLLPLTDINNCLNLDKTKAMELSPMLKVNFIPKIVLENIKLYLAVGEIESPEFITQTLTYARILKDNGARDAESSVLSTMDHFNIVEELCRTNSLISQQLLSFIMS